MQSVKNKTILVVEDDPATSTLEAVYLGRVGYGVRVARTVQEALACVACEKIDLMVLDYQLPGTTGLDLYQRIRATGRDFPVIIATGYQDESLILRALRAGVSDFVIKSQDFLEYLPDAVERVLVQVQTKRDLAHSEARLSAILLSVMDPILAVDGDQRITLFNAAAEAVFGCAQDEARGQVLSRFMPGGLSAHTLHLSAKAHETHCLRADGTPFPAEAAISEIRVEDEACFTVVVRDITERKQAEARLHAMAYYDALTQLPNRTLFFDRMTQALATAARTLRGGTLLFVDMDHFKVINDTMGHAQGDALLQAVSQRLTLEMRPTDTVCRFGGDEFTVLLPDVTRERDAATVTQKILDALSRPFPLRAAHGDLQGATHPQAAAGHGALGPSDEQAGVGLHVTASIGIARYPSDGLDADTLLRHADAAMYRAKQSGKNRYAFYGEQAQSTLVAQQEMEQHLARGLEEDAFLVYYQPRVDVQTGHIVGVEALARWRHPERGIVTPSHFMAAAEQTGLIVAIGKRVLSSAAQQHTAWRRAGLNPVPISVNVSIRQFAAGDWVETVAQILQEADMRAENLEMEIPETLFAQTHEAVEGTRAGLRRLGVRIALDQFGTGNTSFRHFKSHAIDAFKMDASFVRDLGAGTGGAASAAADTVGAMIAMAHGLRAKCIALCVETEPQMAVLRSLGCDAAQGYLFDHPMPAEALARLLSAPYPIAA